MDTQDGQDKQDEKLLHRKLTRSMIRGACEGIPMGLGENFWILVEEKAMASLKTLKPLAKPSC